jgi:hypothetical protein
LEDGFSNILGNRSLVSMEHVDEDRPAIELLDGLLRSGRVADITGGEGISVSHGGSVAGFCQFGLANALEDLLVLCMPFAADGEGREAFTEHVSISTGLEGAEEMIDNLGGQCGEVAWEDRDWRVNGTLLDIAAEDSIVLSLGGLGKDLVDLREVVIISGSGHLVHVGSEVFSIAIDEAFLGSVLFKLELLLGIVVEDSLEALDSGVEGGVGDLGSPDCWKSC